MMSRAFIFVSLCILLAAGALRVYHLGGRSLWLDEAIAANISRGTLSQTLTLTRGLHSAPILDPLILYATEKVSDGAFAVRFPSFLASVLSVFLMLGFASLPSVEPKTAVLAALLLALSAEQIRYAQQVREYSLGVLYASLLLYLFLSWLSPERDESVPLALCVALFLAPFVQYGLVLFGAGMVGALLLLEFAGRRRGRRILHILAAGGCFGLGGILSFFLTLRYQWEGPAFYLRNYYWTPGTSFGRFVIANTRELLATLLLPGSAAALLCLLAIVICLGVAVRRRVLPPLAVLAAASVGIVLVLAMLHKYPYGSVRQCLFLAPVVCLFSASSLTGLADMFGARTGALLLAGMAIVVIVSGVSQIRSLNPYAEIEDVRKILADLREHRAPGENVYVYTGAVPAVDFYMKQRDPLFLYGNDYRDSPRDYALELEQGLAPGTDRFWMLFCHVYQDEDQRIFHDLEPFWSQTKVAASPGCSLYSASRRAGAARGESLPSSAANPADLPPRNLGIRTHDSFWDWNYRISRPTIK